MRYYPICLNLKDRRCLVVGGGQVGTRKVMALLDCGARVTVVSPALTGELSELTAGAQIEWKPRNYRSTDLENIFLIVGATDDAALNRRIHQDAEDAGKLCNIADQPHLCNFILPSVIRQGDLMIAVSTSGKSPAFAKYLRRRMQAQFGPEYGIMLDLMGAIRSRLLRRAHAPEVHKPLFERLIAAGLLEMIRDQRRDVVDALLADVLGDGFTYKALMSNRDQEDTSDASDES